MDGRKKLKENGIPYLRPDDYLAEMVKDDKKMKLIEQKKNAIEEENFERSSSATRIKSEVIARNTPDDNVLPSVFSQTHQTTSNYFFTCTFFSSIGDPLISSLSRITASICFSSLVASALVAALH